MNMIDRVLSIISEAKVALLERNFTPTDCRLSPDDWDAFMQSMRESDIGIHTVKLEPLQAPHILLSGIKIMPADYVRRGEVTMIGSRYNFKDDIDLEVITYPLAIGVAGAKP